RRRRGAVARPAHRRAQQDRRPLVDRPLRRRREPHQRPQDAGDLRVARRRDPADGAPRPGVDHPGARGHALQGVAVAALRGPGLRGQVVPLGPRRPRCVLLEGERERHRHRAAEPLPRRHHRDGPQVPPFALRAAPGAHADADVLQARPMNVEILSTGTELLRGKNVDTNAAWLAQRLADAGLEVRHHQTVDDHFGRLVDSIKLAASRSDLLIMTGGLGPTEDDYTRTAAEEAFHRPLVYRAELWKKIEARFRKTGTRMAQINKRQAYVPK